MYGGNNPWVISSEDRSKHDAQFFQLKPISGYITGDQARGFFMQSGLPVAILGNIWGLADMDQDGKMNKREFSIAMHMIKKKLQGHELPKVIPASLKADPTPAIGSFATPPVPQQAPVNMGMSPGQGVSFGATMPGYPAPPGVYPMTNGTATMGQYSAPAPVMTSGFATLPPGAGISAVKQPSIPNAIPAAPVSGEWAIPHNNKLKYNQTFNFHDRSRKGFIDGMEAKNILSQTGLTHSLLAQIWALSDINADGKLTSDEFCVALHLVDMAKSGLALPAKLPPDLIPPSFRGGATGGPPVGVVKPVAPIELGPMLSSMPAVPTPPPQKDSFGDLLGGIAMGMNAPPPPMQPQDSDRPAETDILSNVTFEDRRKENFDKGQAELERRRAQLQEELKKAEEERLAAERAEQEKRERIRQEQERKKQMEVEKQLEKQRKVEQERDEQRRKALEQRESARREMERQRQMEWERQRRDQLMAEKQRQQVEVEQLQTTVGQLKLELESLDNKKMELRSKTEQARSSVSEFTSCIDDMRQNRDAKQADIENFYKEASEWGQNLMSLQQQRKQCEVQAQAMNPGSDERYQSISQNVTLKKESINKLRSDLSSLETANSAKLGEIDTNSAQFNDVVQQLKEANSELQRLKDAFQQKKNEFSHNNLSKSSQNAPSSDWFGEAFSTATSTVAMTSTTSAASDIWGSSFPAVTASNATSSITTTTSASASKGNLSSIFDDLFSSSSSSTQPSSSQADSSWADAFFKDLKKPDKNPLSGVPEVTPEQVSIDKSGWTKHTALYQFDARNKDEMTLLVGDEVWVKADQTGAEPGWLSGECDGRQGWFPEAYIDPPATEAATSAPNTTPEQPSSTDFSASFDKIDNSNQMESSVEQPAGPSLLTTSDQSPFTAVPSSGPSPTPGQPAPEALLARAMYPWRAKKDNHLTFDKGDVIVVKEQQDIWWSGELAGRVGWFPKSYVKVQESSSPSLASQHHTGMMAANTITAPEPTPPAAINSNQSETMSELYEAAYSYQSPEPGDLSFLQGDIITVVNQNADWWTGRLDGKTGIFPANYVIKYEGEAQPAEQTEPSAFNFDHQFTQQVQQTEQAQETLSPQQHQQLSDGLQQSQGKEKLSTPKKAEIAQVVAPYQATGPEQLSLSPNQLIQVRKKSPSGWWEGELQARGQKRRIGWFPANYVKLLSSSARNTPDGKSLSPTPTLQDAGSRSATPISLPQPTTDPAVVQVVALYNYTAQHQDELTFHKASVINVINKDNADWWRGECNGVTGVFPANYVEPLSTMEQNGHQQGSLSSAGSNDSALAGGCTSEEQKRQNHIHELISTEETYRKDLSAVVDVFYKLLTPILTPEEARVIFINWKEVIMCNTKLVKSMRVRRKMTGEGKIIHTIGDILCENLPHMSPYVRYCSCQLNAAALLQSKSENDARFKEAHKKCVTDPRVGGMPLSSFLLKPMQRVTKYPLLIEKILQHTPEGHPDNQNLQEALNKANEICNQVNEGVREKENSDRLEWIQEHVLCDGLSEKLVFNSVTNCLGPRKYLHSGTLYKTKSGKELIGFLFSDFLLLTQPQRHLPATANIFSLDSKTNIQFKMYRNPIFLNDIMISKVSDSETESQTFQLSHIDRVYTLKAVSNIERDAWLKKIQAASKHYLETERKKREKAHSVRLELRSSSMGRLLVIIEEGFNLIAGDEVLGKSDPYCEVSMGAQEHKTKVVNNCLNPKWNASMQFTIKDLQQDVLCITVYDRDLFTPNDFLGRTEVRIDDILKETRTTKGPIIKKLPLLEVDSGEVAVKLDLQLYGET